MDNIKILSMQPKHIEFIVSLEKTCFSEPWSFESLKSELDNPNAIFLVAENNEKCLGYIGMHTVCDEGYITNIAVLPDFRGNGVGTLILNNIITLAEKSGLRFISLEVRVSNKNAMSLYENLGFEKVGVRKNFYRLPNEDAALMTKYINYK